MPVQLKLKLRLKERKRAELVAAEKIGTSVGRQPLAQTARAGAHGIARFHGLGQEMHRFFNYYSFVATRNGTPNAMCGKIFRCYLMFCLLAGSSAAAGNVAYQSGKLIQIARDVPHVDPAKGIFRGFPTYTFQIQVQNHVYAGSCVVLKKFEPEWRVNDTVQFRITKKKIYLRRRNGKELELNLLTTYPDSGMSGLF